MAWVITGVIIFLIIAGKTIDGILLRAARGRLEEKASALEPMTWVDFAYADEFDRPGDPRWRKFKLSDYERGDRHYLIRAKLSEWGYFPFGNGKNESPPEQNNIYEMYVHHDEPWEKGSSVVIADGKLKLKVYKVLDIVTHSDKYTNKPFLRRRVLVKALPSSIRRFLELVPDVLPKPKLIGSFMDLDR